MPTKDEPKEAPAKTRDQLQQEMDAAEAKYREAAKVRDEAWKAYQAAAKSYSESLRKA